MALNNRISIIDKAIITATGNSLIVCGDSTAPQINTSSMIKTDGTTTRDWNSAGSSASLNILADSTILYAELIWFSTVKSNDPSALDVRSIADNPITLQTPNGSFQITPTNTEIYTTPSGTIDKFRSADVTNTISTTLSGNYTVSKVPTSIPPTGLSDTKAGWTLVVIYRNATFKPKKIDFLSGLSFIQPGTALQNMMVGFTTSYEQIDIAGSMFLAAANANPLIGQESLKGGSSFASLVQLGNPIGIGNSNPGTAPNNPYNNIFAGQINVCDPLNSSVSLININGTNGTNNHDAFLPAQVVGARNKWDLTNINLINALTVNQNQLAIQFLENAQNSSVELTALGSQINALAPSMTGTFSMYEPNGGNANIVEVGEQVILFVQLKNRGDGDANNVIVSTAHDPNCSFIPGSLIINGVHYPNFNFTSDINAGTVPAKGVTTVQASLRIDSTPANNTLSGSIGYSYSFTSGTNSPIYTNVDSTNVLTAYVQSGKLTAIKTASKNTAVIGDTINYSIAISNTGTQELTNITFQDLIDQYSSFVPGSLKIDTVSYPLLNPNVMIPLSNLASGASTTVTFSVVIDDLPPSTKINNYAAITYSYLLEGYPTPETETTISNITSIQLQYYEIIGNRYNNNNYPNPGDTVTYTLDLTNIGNIPASNVAVLEPPILGSEFITGSVTINGTSQPTLNPFTGFTLTSPINPQTTTKITYNVRVITPQPTELVENIAQIPFKYQITPGGPVISEEKDSNKVITRANFIVMNTNETVDKAYATIDSNLYYKVTFTNNGNINATNTIFQSAIQPETTFVPGTVIINGVSYPSYNPNIGFGVDTIAPGNTVTVEYVAKVNSVPNPNIVYNNAQLTYDYKPDPNGAHLTSTISSNTVQTIINVASYTITKSCNKDYVQIGDGIVYTSVITNTGTVKLTNVKFFDTLPSYVSQIPGQLYINGILYPNYDVIQGFTLPDIHPSDIVTITFPVTVLSAPIFGYVVNISNMTCQFTLDPTTPTIKETKSSNEVSTKIVNGTLSVNKTASLAYATLNDVITYAFTISNTGNVPVNNSFFYDNIPAPTSFIAESVYINGVHKPTYDPTLGFNLGTLTVGQVVKIIFDVKVNSVPTPNTISNNGSVSFNYYVNPSDQPLNKTVTSNNANTTINISSSTLTKSVDKAFANVGDTLNYTVVAKNTGTVNLTNIIFTDLIPAGTTFTTGSVTIDGVSYPNYNVNTGFSLPDITPGGEVLVGFKAIVISVPTPPTIINTASINYQYKISPTGQSYSDSKTSNSVTTNIIQVTVTNVKSVSKTYATVGDSLTYTSVITNNGNVQINNITFLDVLSSYLTFTAGSVKINNVTYNSYNPNNGFALDPINPNGSVTVEFKATVASLPPSGTVTNNSTVEYFYTVDPNKPSVLGTVTSNTVTTYIKVGSATLTKQADRVYARINDVVNYSFVLTNTGNTTLKNLLFTDTIQTESQFNTGSVYVNGVNKPLFNPNLGFALDDMPIGSVTNITFSVTVLSIPASGKLLNSATTNYSYYIDPNGSLINSSVTSNTTTVNVNDTIVTATKLVDKTIAKINDNLLFTINIKNEGNVPATNVLFKDILDINISFNTGSVTVNGGTQPAFDPNVGFSIPNINPNVTSTVTFTAKINTRPSDNVVENFADIKYDYTPVPLEPPVTVEFTTNTTNTYVAVGELTLTKAVDKTYATVGDTINYTVNIKNTGSVNATTLTFLDTLPASATFVAGSVVLNGVSKPSFNPNVGFAMPDLTPSTSNVVTFSIIASSLPASGKIENTAQTSFKYRLTPTDPETDKTATSNKVTTYINKAILTLNKTVNTAYATLNDILNYTVTITNSGDVDALTVFFQDSLQSNLTFVTGSVKVDNVSKPTFNPNTGFNLADIAPNGSTTVTFDAKVTSVPYNYIVSNSALTDYSYHIDPSKPAVLGTSTSNTVTTLININNVTITKNVNLAYATIGNILKYTVNIANLGTVDATNINFRDVIPTGLTFVTGSVKIDGVAYPSYDPYNSFSLSTLIVGASTVVTFDAAVTSVPNPSLIKNKATITYNYRINPAGPDIITEITSNEATTQINKENLTITKAVDKAYATIGDVLTYSFNLTNSGNVNLTNIIFIDSLPSHVSFNEGSVKVNGVTQPDFNPTTGFALDTLQPLDTTTVSFTITINSMNDQQSVVNFANVTYSYNINPAGPTYTDTVRSNAVVTLIRIGSMTSSKVVSLAYATIDDVLDYTVVVQNLGNTTITNLNFIDTLSNGGTFVAGSVYLNGFVQPNLNPITGFSLPDLDGGNTHNITFKVKVTSVPIPSQITNYATANGSYKIDPLGPSYQITTTTNTVSTQINLGSLALVKTVDKDYAKVSDTLTYTTVITNNGNVNATNLAFYDIVQAELSFVPGTVRINGVVNPNLSPSLGFGLGNLAPNQSVTVTFDAKINSLPTPPIAVNKSQVEFSYKINPQGSTLTTTTFSNTVTTNIVKGILTLTKGVDKSIATIGDILTFTINVTNTGNVVANDVTFNDTPSTGVTFNSGSVYVNGVNYPLYDPTVGFTLGDVGIGNVVTVQFAATVTSVPASNKVTNQASVTFKYVVDPKQPPITDTNYSNTTTTNIAVGSLSVVKAVDKQFATIGQNLTYTVTITNTGNINATNVIFLDPTPANSVFVLGSVSVNGIYYPSYNPAVGFPLSDMTPGQIITVVYQVKVVS